MEKVHYAKSTVWPFMSEHAILMQNILFRDEVLGRGGSYTLPLPGVGHQSLVPLPLNKNGRGKGGFKCEQYNFGLYCCLQ